MAVTGPAVGQADLRRTSSEMGTIKTIISGDLTLRKAIGSLALTEVINAIEESYSGTPTKYIIWDNSEATLDGFTADDLRHISQMMLEHGQRRRGGKSPLVVPADAEYGLSRMLDTFMALQGTPYEVRTFGDMSDSIQWLGIEHLPGETSAP